jgi:hypothetical protein
MRSAKVSRLQPIRRIAARIQESNRLAKQRKAATDPASYLIDSSAGRAHPQITRSNEVKRIINVWLQHAIGTSPANTRSHCHSATHEKELAEMLRHLPV